MPGLSGQSGPSCKWSATELYYSDSTVGGYFDDETIRRNDRTTQQSDDVGIKNDIDRG